MNSLSISIVVPAYNRVAELSELLESVSTQSTPPDEILICEDHSPDRAAIRDLCASYRDQLEKMGIRVTYIENPENVGYDANLRKCIESAASSWALILGNDDILLPNAIATVRAYLAHCNSPVVSRSFLRFKKVGEYAGKSSNSSVDTVYRVGSSAPRYIFRCAGFIGGLIISVDFAKSVSTTQFDGTLFYQINLAAHAFCDGGIGYISKPYAAGRFDSAPMFGAATGEAGVHIPGGYTATGRAAMWKGVLSIAQVVSDNYGFDLVSDLRTELAGRQSFHVFEMNSRASRRELRQLRDALMELGLFSHPVPRILYFINYYLSPVAPFIYRLARRIVQKA